MMNPDGQAIPVAQRLRKFIEETFLAGSFRTLADSDSFLDSGIIDSTGILELIAFLEGTYGIRVEDEDAIPDNLDSIERISAYLSRKLDRALSPDLG